MLLHDWDVSIFDSFIFYACLTCFNSRCTARSCCCIAWRVANNFFDTIMWLFNCNHRFIYCWQCCTFSCLSQWSVMMICNLQHVLLIEIHVKANQQSVCLYCMSNSVVPTAISFANSCQTIYLFSRSTHGLHEIYHEILLTCAVQWNFPSTIMKLPPLWDW